MQRFSRHQVDQFGNPANGATCSVYLSGTSLGTLATIYSGTDTTDTPTTTITNPIVIGSSGDIAFAVPDGDYDIVIAGSNLPATTYIYRWNAFDGSTASAAPFSQVALSMPGEFSVSGSPAGASGTLTVSKATQTANLVYAGPTSGGAAQPTFRAMVAADISSIACLLTTGQTVAGDKVFSGNTSIGGTLTVTGAVTNNSTLTQTGAATFSNTISLAKDKDFYVAGAQGWGLVPAQCDISLGVNTGTICTSAVVGAGNCKIMKFADAAVNGVSGMLILPEGYAAGTDIYPFVSWTTDGTNTGNVRWGFEYSVITGHNTGVFPAFTTINVTTAAQGTVSRLMYSEFPAITGTSFLPHTVIIFRLFRDGTHGTDTCTDSALVPVVGIAMNKSRFSIKNRTPNFYT